MNSQFTTTDIKRLEFMAEKAADLLMMSPKRVTVGMIGSYLNTFGRRNTNFLKQKGLALTKLLHLYPFIFVLKNDHRYNPTVKLHHNYWVETHIALTRGSRESQFSLVTGIRTERNEEQKTREGYAQFELHEAPPLTDTHQMDTRSNERPQPPTAARTMRVLSPARSRPLDRTQPPPCIVPTRLTRYSPPITPCMVIVYLTTLAIPFDAARDPHWGGSFLSFEMPATQPADSLRVAFQVLLP